MSRETFTQDGLSKKGNYPIECRAESAVDRGVTEGSAVIQGFGISLVADNSMLPATPDLPGEFAGRLACCQC
jgi:hypothetical protein